MDIINLSAIEHEFNQRANELIEAGKLFYRQGIMPATSGNLSARLSDGRIAVTVSGRHKGNLLLEDIMLVDRAGHSLDGRKPSAETLLHIQVYNRFPGIGAVLHPHSVNATLLSGLQSHPLLLQDYEILKAFPGIDSHDCTIVVPVFENCQDIPSLAGKVDLCMDEYGSVYGYLIAGHGFYTWGVTVEDAIRHVEAFEFLFECEMRKKGLKAQ